MPLSRQSQGAAPLPGIHFQSKGAGPVGGRAGGGAAGRGSGPRTARWRLTAAEHDVRVAAWHVAVDHAAAEAVEIKAMTEVLWQKRRSLWSPTAALTNQSRLLGPASVPGLPAAVHRSVGEAMDTRVDNAWNAHLARLCDDPEAPLTD